MSLLGALRRRDPGLPATRRALRVTVAASVAFYLARYGFDDPAAATYAAFGAIAMGALSTVEAAPRTRTRVYAAALVVGLGLVTLGTFLARSTAAAVLGMAVVGVLIPFAAVGGSSYAGIGNGLQLFYILPSFPPYAPHALASRLVGLALGIGLTALADRVLLPAPAPARYGPVLGAAARAVARYVQECAGSCAAGSPASPALADAARAAQAAVDAARPSRLPVATRPGAPTRANLALTHAGEAVREVYGCALRLHRAGPAPGADAEPLRAVLHASAATLLDLAGALAAGRVPQPPDALRRADEVQAGTRLSRLGGARDDAALAAGMVTAGLVAEIASAAAVAADAGRVAAGAPVPDPQDRAGLWYLDRSPAALWRSRLTANLDLRSVVLRNALRVGAALAAARLLASALDLTHGFWVLLATLTLMRTSAADTGSALPAAFAGTLVGALAGAAVLAAIPDRVVFEVALPVVLAAALLAGPLLGAAAGQAGFTLAVICIFVQVAPASWRLAEVRLFDVVVGGLLGAVIGLVAWPRGAGGQLRAETARALRSCGQYVRTCAGVLGDGSAAADHRLRARRELVYAESVRAQSLHERVPPAVAGLDWQAVMVAAHRAVRGGEALARRYPSTAPPPWPEAVRLLAERAGRVAAAYDGLAGSLAAPSGPDGAGPVEGPAAEADWLRGVLSAGAPDPAVLRVLDTTTWLVGLAEDVARAGQAGTAAGT